MTASRLFVIVLLLYISIQLRANQNNRDQGKERIIEARLAAMDPSVLEIFKAGTLAMDQNNLGVADSLYSIVVGKVPGFDPALRRLGLIRFQAGKSQEAVDLCQKALAVDRSAYNLLSLATCYFNLGRQPNSSPQNLIDATVLLREAEPLPDGMEFDFILMRAQLAILQNDYIDFRSQAWKLAKNYPDEMYSHYYAALVAATDEKWTKAKEEILIAGKLGLPDETVNHFLDSGVRSKATLSELPYYFLGVFLIWIAGLLFLFLVGKLLSNFTMHSLEKQNRSEKTSGFQHGLRRLYRFLINLGGIYYYISLPIILVLVVVMVLGMFYLFYMIGRFPVQIMLLVTVGSGMTIYGMIRSLLVKVKYSDPGRELLQAEAPDLYRLTTEVANTMGTKPIAEIRITQHTDLAVYEKGSWREKLKDNGRRILILGTGVVKDFKQNDFRAVLAHEYGHFSHRDTAGGEVALRVRSDMHKYFYALYSAGQNVWWNIAFQFLRLYNFLFRRISHGATRLQEVLADRVAAQTYGVKAFRDGLTYVIKRNIEFSKYANSEIEEAMKTRRPLNNLYELHGISEVELEEELQAELSKKTSEDDTHPSPVDRFRYLEGIDAGTFPEDSAYVRELFFDFGALTAEMTALIEKKVLEA